ncbi:tripartite tricarboxylate transporter substrate binding protein [Cupriavidus sp. WGtm5]|uniref:Bug family tripartite tricarboxylate transporter substrate binding protein n=1 Tax=Cupriavidus TaxID=106589 RepID=UPI000E10310A|nr:MULTISPECIES: tripartite tricarboxylate transporter substrate binding protein [Cupriavidus]MCO4888449.1 tripartite tricarboxylate transporter substrate binding protein [Cupriavidus sp. WGtm5]SPA30254.1 conserved exported hypothetical protein [Cupriavidus taiwanensis]SPA55962.1 conserved exported protein of unknown function [Cupriavidus taiwanensis]
MLRKFIFLATCFCLFAANAAMAQGQVVRIVVPIGVGNSFDTSARVLAEALRKATGQSYIVDNRPGGGGIVGTAEVARAKPDGLTLLYTTAGHATNAALHAKLQYDSIKSFTPISMITQSSGFVLLVRADSPFRTVRDLIAAAKSKPGSVSFGSFGIGNTTHVVGALFARGAGVQMLHVPYRSPVSDFLGGQVDSIFIGESTAMPLLKDGKVRALAISASKRSPTLPDVPTFEEVGVKGADVPAWSGLLGPAGMSPESVKKLYAALQQAVKTPEFQASLKINAANVVLMAPDQFAKELESEVVRFKTQLPSLGIQME